MPRRFPISILAAAFALPWVAWTSVPVWPQTALAGSQPGAQKFGPGIQRQPPSQEELRTRTKELIANQHRDDSALDKYEWVERHVDQTGGVTPRVLEDKIIRLVSNGAGTSKVILSDNGKPTDPAESRRQMQTMVQVLQMMVDPNDPRMKVATAKHQKRMRDRADLVDNVTDAFVLTWVGQESRNGRDCDLVQANPNPNFHPHSMLQDAMRHISAKVWVDHSSNQIVHAEAQILSDISFGGGLLGKLYRGGTFSLDQKEVAPGVWFATRYQYDFSGRKFLFPFEEHQFIEARDYRLVGSPKEALALIEAELAGRKQGSGDP